MIEAIKEDLIQIGTNAISKEEVLKEISGLISQKNPALNKDEVFKKLLAREKIGSTALTQGVAIPHCKSDKLDDIQVGLIVVKDGIDFNSLDEEPTKLIFFSVGPDSRQNQHISTLTSISKIAKDTSIRDKIINETSSKNLFGLLFSQNQSKNEPHAKCQFVIHIQDEEIFMEILEALSTSYNGGISVLDANIPGKYLHKLPLFSSFWNDVSDSFSKIIIAVIDRRFMNETIRQINMIKKDSKTGVLITVNDLLYSDGTLEF